MLRLPAMKLLVNKCDTVQNIWFRVIMSIRPACMYDFSFTYCTSFKINQIYFRASRKVRQTTHESEDSTDDAGGRRKNYGTRSIQAVVEGVSRSTTREFITFHHCSQNPPTFCFLLPTSVPTKKILHPHPPHSTSSSAAAAASRRKKYTLQDCTTTSSRSKKDYSSRTTTTTRCCSSLEILDG